MTIPDRKIVLRKLRLSNSDCPYDRWFYSLQSEQLRQIVDARLTRVMAGNLGYCRSVGQGVHELKIAFGHGYRIYFSMLSMSEVVLLYGGQKKSQKKDIKKAQALWKLFRDEA